jgi:hypothetical protein
MSGGRPLALVIEGISAPSGQPVRMNVFVNLPDANRRTSVDDPHFAGLVALLEPSGIATRRPSVALDLSSMSVINPDRPCRSRLSRLLALLKWLRTGP